MNLLRLRHRRNPTEKRSVLILAHSWPPDANVGSVRPVYLVRQLSRFGWCPFVVTVREKYYEHHNTAGIAGSEFAHVIRTRCLPNPRHVYLWVKNNLLSGFIRQILSTRAPVKNTDASTHDGNEVSITAPESLRRTVLSLFHTPDQFQGWFPFAFIASLHIILHHRPLCVISTGPPFTSHLVALVLKKIFRNVWIADFRDPWSWYEDRLTKITSKLSDQINCGFEKMVMRCADRIVCVTPAMTERYRQLYPNLPDNKWVTITNGFDSDEFAGLDPVEKPDRFTISYVGSFDFSRTPLLALKAVGELIAEGRLDKHRLNFRFVGPCQFVGEKPLVEMLTENKLDEITNVIGLVPRTEALRELLKANVLILLGGTQRLSVAAKTYEYIAAGKPILAILEEGETAGIIRKIDRGCVVAPDDLQGAKDAIGLWYDEYLQNGQMKEELQSVDSTITTDEFSWNKLGARYVTLLRECSIDQ